MNVKNLKFLSLVVATSSVLGSYGVASASETAQKISLDAEELFKGNQKTDLVGFSWESLSETSKVIHLQRLELTKLSQKNLTDLVITIPGEVAGKQVVVSPEALSDLSGSRKLKLYLIFEKRNGKRVKLPQNSSKLLQNSSAVYGIDFKDIDTSTVNDMTEMFRGCKNIRTLNLRTFCIKRFEPKKVYRMFCECEKLKKVNISSFSFIKKLNDDLRSTLLFNMFNDIQAWDNDNNSEMLWHINTKPNITIILDSKYATKPLEKRCTNEYDLDSDNFSDFGSESFGSTSVASSPRTEKLTEEPPFVKRHKYCETIVVEENFTEYSAGANSKPFDAEEKPELEQNEEPLVLPNQTKDGALFTNNVVIIPKVKLPVKEVSGGYITKERPQKPVKLPNQNKAEFTKSHIVGRAVLKNPNADVDVCYFSKVNKAELSKNAEKPGAVKEKEGMTTELKQKQKVMQNNNLTVMRQEEYNKRSKNTWYSCIISTIKKIYTKICELFC